MHFHKQPEIIYCNHGSIEITQNNQILTLYKGDVAIISPYVAHSFNGGHGRGWCLGIPLQFDSSFSKYFLCLNSNQFIIKNCKKSKILHKTLMNFKNANSLTFAKQQFLVQNLLDEILKLINPNKLQNIKQLDIVSQIIYFLDENYTHDINMQSLISNFMYSRSYLSECFNNVFQCSLPAFLTNIRLSAFIKKQLTLKGSISEDAFNVGFKSTRTFYKSFSTQFNLTPTEYISKIK